MFVSTSDIDGHGVFARRCFCSGDYIGTYRGPQAKKNGKYVLWVENRRGGETGRRGANRLRYLNHSTKPNAEFDGFDLYALKSIPAGTEITIDYGPDAEEWL